jgi:hypothetical protein
MIIGLLGVLAAASAAGMRIALPLLVIGLMQRDLWSKIPILSNIPPPVLIAVLTSWSLFELVASKKLLGQRTLQLIQLLFSPFVGAVMAIAAVNITEVDLRPLWLIGSIGGLLALVLKLVQVGWFFRLGKLPLWAILAEDILCVLLVLFAFKAPQEGGSIAMLLLWLALRSSTEWRNWYLEKKRDSARS